MTEKWATKFERKPGRWVFEPTPEYRDIGEGVRSATAKLWQAPVYFFHLRAGGHVAALVRHAKHKYFLRCDVEDFFGRVTRTRVTRCLKEYFGYERAREMANDSTVRHPTDKARWVLPYGFVQSPILASLALAKSRLGTTLRSLHKTAGLTVSVYVDDIIVSCDDLDALETIKGALIEAAERSNFSFNAHKIEGPASSITAFNIDLANASLAIADERFDEFAQDLASSTSELQRNGILSYVRSVNEDQADLLAA